MRVLLLVSAFNGLTQRVWCTLREADHEVSVHLALDATAMIRAVDEFDPDVVLCPFLKERIPEQIWRHRRTIVIHPGPVGDRGASSLDHAITGSATMWGVTALQAVEEMDAGPVWATRTFPLPADPLRKSELYSGLVADAAMTCVAEVLTKAATPGFEPVPLERAHRAMPSGLLPNLRQADRAFSWHDRPEDIVRRIRAADGSPGVLTTMAGMPLHAFDAYVDVAQLAQFAAAQDVGQVPADGFGRAEPGTVVGRHQGSVLVAAGDGPDAGGVWIGHLKPRGGIKLPATAVLSGALRGVLHRHAHPAPWIRYERTRDVGTLTFSPYNGALSTKQCARLSAALASALSQDTRALVLRGADDVFCNGIHLNVIEAAKDPAGEAWRNIRAINAVCRRICATSRQVVVAAVSGNAGAGGAMLALGADVVVARDGVVLNPYYEMGLYGSELHSLTLPRRVGARQSAELLDQRLPVDAAQARSMGMIDAVGPRDPARFRDWLTEVGAWAASDAGRRAGTSKARPQRPLGYYETAELAEMSRDMFDDRNGFADQRKAFVHKTRATSTPAKLAVHSPVARAS